MATSRKKAQQPVKGRSVSESTLPPGDYVRITADNALEDLRRAHSEHKVALVHLAPHENVGKAYIEALEQLMIEVGFEQDGLTIGGVWQKDDRPQENAIVLTADGVDEQMQRSIEENLPVVIPMEALPAYKAWQERDGAERRRRIEKAWSAVCAV